jgi:hypothetical protein
MKFLSTLFIALVLSAELFAPLLAQAQGTFYVSNLGQTPTGNAAVASDAWLAGLFQTGTDSGGYTLNSIQLLMDTASESPNGFTVSLYSFNNGNFEPGSSLGSLAGSTDPSAGGIFTYTASNLTLSPSTDYFIVLTAATPLASGSYYWSAANTSSYDSSDSWILEGGYDSSSDGSSWFLHRTNPLQFAVYATPTPEPSELALGALGTLFLGFRLQKSASKYS